MRGTPARQPSSFYFRPVRRAQARLSRALRANSSESQPFSLEAGEAPPSCPNPYQICNSPAGHGRAIMGRSGGGSYHFPRVRVSATSFNFLIGNFLGTRIVTDGVCPSPERSNWAFAPKTAFMAGIGRADG